MSDSTYTCEYCGESFNTPAAKGSHIALHKTRTHPVEKLIAIRELADQKGRAPTWEEMAESGAVSPDSVEYDFGSWVEGVKAAGLEPVRYPSVSRDELLAAIETLADQVGHAPRVETWKKRGAFSIDTVRAEFGSWTAAVEEAGYRPISTAVVPHKVPRDEIIDAIQSLADKKGRAPCAAEMIEEGEIWPSLIRRRFGSYDAGVRAAGLEPYHPKQAEKATDEEVLKAVRDLATELGHPPTVDEMEAHGACSASLVEARFGSWNRGLICAGFEPNLRRDISDDELFADLDRLESELGHPPRCMEYHRQGKFAVQTFQDRFGEWDVALKAAGYEPPGPRTGPEHHGWKGPDGWSRGPRYYGANWAAQRQRALTRDDYVCQTPGCEITDEQHRDRYDRGLHVHHIQPLRTFFEDGAIDYDEANALNNLVSVCIPHHSRWEQASPQTPEFE